MGLESEYANCKTLYVLPPAGYNTQESNVPVMVRIGRSAGKYRDDTSDVFEKLGKSYQKMAVSLDDGVTECPVEVTEWDVDRQLGILFVKIPSVPTTGMTLKLWYDSTHANNTANVGAIGSAVGQSVWANGFASVWHMKNSGGLVLDSTSNQNHGTIYGATVTQGPLGRCLSFDGVDDYVETASGATMQNFSVETAITHHGSPTYDGITVGSSPGYGDGRPWGLRCQDYGGACIYVFDDDGVTYISPQGGSIGTEYTTVSATYDGATARLYLHGVETATGGAAYTLLPASKFWFGRMWGDFFGGMISYVAISSVARSPAWIALTHASLKDELIAFSTPGTESLTGNERMRLKPDGTLIANEFVEV